MLPKLGISTLRENGIWHDPGVEFVYLKHWGPLRMEWSEWMELQFTERQSKSSDCILLSYSCTLCSSPSLPRLTVNEMYAEPPDYNLRYAAYGNCVCMQVPSWQAGNH